MVCFHVDLIANGLIWGLLIYFEDLFDRILLTRISCLIYVHFARRFLYRLLNFLPKPFSFHYARNLDSDYCYFNVYFKFDKLQCHEALNKHSNKSKFDKFLQCKKIENVKEEGSSKMFVVLKDNCAAHMTDFLKPTFRRTLRTLDWRAYSLTQ